MTDQECFEAAKKCGLTNAEFSAWRHTLQEYATEIERIAIEKERERILHAVARYRNSSMVLYSNCIDKSGAAVYENMVRVLDLIMQELGQPSTEQSIKDDGKTRVADHVPDSGKMVKQLENAMHRITKLEDQVAAMERRIQGLERCEQARQPIGSPGQNGWPGWPAWTGPYQAPNVWLQAESTADLMKVHGLSK